MENPREKQRFFLSLVENFRLAAKKNALTDIISVYTVYVMVSQKQRAYSFIRDKMLRGSLPTGSRISDFTICKQLGISRAPIREAISQLVSEGLVEQIPHYGSFVKRLSYKELDELFELREMLESHAASKAAERIGPEGIQELRKLCDEMLAVIEGIRAGGLKDLEGDLLTRQIRNDVAFHLLIMRVADRPKHLQVVSDLRILTNLFSQRGREGSRNAIRQLTRAHSEHCKIVEALESGEATLTSKRMATHIRKGKEAALAYYRTHCSAGPEEEGGDSAAPHIHDMVRKMELYTNVNENLPED